MHSIFMMSLIKHIYRILFTLISVPLAALHHLKLPKILGLLEL